MGPRRVGRVDCRHFLRLVHLRSIRSSTQLGESQVARVVLAIVVFLAAWGMLQFLVLRRSSGRAGTRRCAALSDLWTGRPGRADSLPRFRARVSTWCATGLRRTRSSRARLPGVVRVVDGGMRSRLRRACGSLTPPGLLCRSWRSHRFCSAPSPGTTSTSGRPCYSSQVSRHSCATGTASVGP